MTLSDKQRGRVSLCERALYAVGISGGIVALLCPFLFPYFGDTVGVATLTICNLWAVKWAKRASAPQAAANTNRLKGRLFGHASLAYALLSGWEWLQSTGAVWGVYDRHDYVAFTAGYLVTVALLAGSYRAALRNPRTGTLLW